MSPYSLYAHDRCDRCGAFTSARTSSFFTDDTICTACLAQESRLMGRLRAEGVNLAIMADCGFVPRGGSKEGHVAAVPDCPAPLPARGPAIGRRVTEAELRKALRRLRARSALLRVPPGELGTRRNRSPLG